MYLDNKKQFYYRYDLDAATFKYGRLGGPDGLSVPGRYGAKTSGSSTTVTASAGSPFVIASAGDVIVFTIPPGARSIRKIASVSSPSEIVVDSAIDLGTVGVPFEILPFRIGTTTAFGWHMTHMYTSITVGVHIATLNADALDIQVEIHSGDHDNPVVIHTQNFPDPTTESINIAEVAAAVRVGVKATATFAGADDIDIWLQGEMRSR